MISRVRWVSIACVALLTVASACPAAAAPNYAPGKGGIGGLVGGSYFRLDRVLGDNWFGDYSEGAQARLSFNGNFRYVISRHYRWQVSPGFTWSAYSNVEIPFPDLNFPNDRAKDQNLTLVAPATAELQYTIPRGLWIYHAGAGAGVYRVWVENHRKVLKDPVTFKLHRGVYPGAVVEIGAERFLRGITNLSVELSLANHLVFAQRKEQFVSGYDSNLMVNELNLGVNYYFDMVRPKKTAPAGLPGGIQ
jgi:hypothetical protein